MKIVSVSAPCNGSGKTSLILSILKTFPGIFSVAKFTTIYQEEQFCPAKDHDCACHRLMGEYLICTDPQVLSQPDTDTGKIWRAGAKQTLWCVSRMEGYRELIKEFSARYLNHHSPLLMEGNRVVHYLRPDLRLVVVNPALPSSWWKDDTQEFLQRADFVLLNSYPVESQVGSEQVDDLSVRSALARVQSKQVTLENGETLNQWRDHRLYQAVHEIVEAHYENSN